jgi:hypothetical protein
LLVLLAFAVAGTTAAGLSAATASGTIGRGATVMKVADGFAYESLSFLGEEPCIRLRLADRALDHSRLAASIDFERELDRQLDGAQHVELEFSPQGAWNGGGAYYLQGASCGWCQNGAQSDAARTRVEGGRLKGTVRAKASDVEGGDGAIADLVLDTPVTRHVGLSTLPAPGGGEPGKAFVACSKAMASQDEAKIVAACFAPDDPWLVKQNLDYFNGPDFADHADDWFQALLLRDVVVGGGRAKGDQAEILVRGTVTRRYGQDEPPSVEKYKGRVFLRRGSTGWRFTGQQLESDYD